MALLSLRLGFTELSGRALTSFPLSGSAASTSWNLVIWYRKSKDLFHGIPGSRDSPWNLPCAALGDAKIQKKEVWG